MNDEKKCDHPVKYPLLGFGGFEYGFKCKKCNVEILKKGFKKLVTK